jgi:hypothetical protein
MTENGIAKTRAENLRALGSATNELWHYTLTSGTASVMGLAKRTVRLGLMYRDFLVSSACNALAIKSPQDTALNQMRLISGFSHECREEYRNVAQITLMGQADQQLWSTRLARLSLSAVTGRPGSPG